MGNHGRLADLTVSKEALRKMEPGCPGEEGQEGAARNNLWGSGICTQKEAGGHPLNQGTR